MDEENGSNRPNRAEQRPNLVEWGLKTLRYLGGVSIIVSKGCLRLLFVLLAVGVGIWAAAIAVAWVRRTEQLPALVGIAIGATTILAVMRGLLDSLAAAIDYVLKQSGASIPKLMVQVAFATLGLGFVYSIPQVRNVTLHVDGPFPPIVFDDGNSLFTSYVVFKEGNAHLSGSQTILLHDLVNALVACIGSSNDKVTIFIRGFASSSGPDRENAHLYQRRAESVRELMYKFASQNAGKRWNRLRALLEIEVTKWSSLPVMEERRLFTDTVNDGRYSRDAGRLNRRVEIRVERAGACYGGAEKSAGIG